MQVGPSPYPKPVCAQVGPSLYKRILAGTLNVSHAHGGKDCYRYYSRKHDAVGELKHFLLITIIYE